MRQSLVFIFVVFLGLFGAFVFNKSQQAVVGKSILKVYATSSFVATWGAGPLLKAEFEKFCECQVQFFESPDSTILLNRISNEMKSGGVDLVLSLDQFDLENFITRVEWRKINFDINQFEDQIKGLTAKSNLVPYDWGVFAFVVKKGALSHPPRSLQDLSQEFFRSGIALQDPRTSSVGLQFLVWLIQVMGEEKAFEYLRELGPQIHSYSPGWSTAYGLFQKDQAKMTFSYSTSPLYHIIEEKTDSVQALEFSEGHPIQVEYLGVPQSCTQCQLAEKFAQFMLSREGQKILMTKNYMLPVIRGVKEGTPFASVPNFKWVDQVALPTLTDRQRILNKWTQLRRGE